MPVNPVEEFKSDIKGMDALDDFTMQRFITECDAVKHELHCFADAYIHAYAAVIYLSQVNEFHISLQPSRRLLPLRQSQSCAQHIWAQN